MNDESLLFQYSAAHFLSISLYDNELILEAVVELLTMLKGYNDIQSWSAVCFFSVFIAPSWDAEFLQFHRVYNFWTIIL